MPYISSFFDRCDNSVSIATDYGLDGQGTIPGKSKSFFFALMNQDWFQGPSSLPQNGCQGHFPYTVKWSGNNGNYSPSFTVEVKMVELYLHSPTM
jgi:hypothetical protein